MSGTVKVDADSWKTEVADAETPVLVDFWAEWCGPCKAIGPILDEIAAEQEGKLKIAKVNVDENQQLAGKFGIRSIPTLLLMQGGEIKEQMIGAMNKSALMGKIEPHLS